VGLTPAEAPGTPTLAEPGPRFARVVLTTQAGKIFGVLPPLEIATSWWQDVEPLVAAIRQRDGIVVTVLRLLEAALPRAPGGQVTYLAEVTSEVEAPPFEGILSDHPLRAAYAKPGGPAADLAWARSVLTREGIALSAPPVQIRTWNLSSLWRMETDRGAVWLKVLPAFLAREAAIVAHLTGERVPRLLATEGPRMLMPEIPGRDLYGADTAELLEMVSLLVDLQARRLGHEAELLDLGLVDWRSRSLIAAITRVIQLTAGQLDAGECAVLGDFAEELPSRMAKVEACGIPETLMHSDFHPGNVRGSKGAMTFLDWGEAGVGHPLLDQAAMFGSIAADQVETVRAHWSECWRSVMPGCDPLAAFALLAPVAVARQAAIYQTFLDNIEPSEHPYHRGDPADRLRRVASLAREEPPL
jgi:hypothetical protein